MAFQNSPKLGNPTKPVLSLSGWLYRLRYLMAGLTFLLVVVDILVVLIVRPDQIDATVGGMDGCLTDGRGQPVAASVAIGDQVRSTTADGCFFFAQLPPGTQQLRVQVDGNVVYGQNVNILSGQAVGLNSIQVMP